MHFEHIKKTCDSDSGRCGDPVQILRLPRLKKHRYACKIVDTKRKKKEII